MVEFIPGRRKLHSISIYIIIAIVSVMQNFSFGQTLKSDLPVTNGAVTTMYRDGNTMYVGGTFSYAGPSTGRGVLLNSQTGLYDKNFPKVNGTIMVCVPDNNGGWYIGGNFTKVGSEYRNSAAHISAGGQVDKWNPNIIYNGYGDGSAFVETIALNNSIVYLGGAFDQVGSTVRKSLAAVDLNGNATSWNPDAAGDFGPEIRSIVATDTVIYFAGNFSKLNVGNNYQIVRANIAAVDVVIGMPTAWDAPVTGGQYPTFIHGICLSDTTLYVYGNFDYIGSGLSVRHGIGAVNTKLTGNGETLVTSWNPQSTQYISSPTVIISSIAITGDSVFIGGNFDKFGSLSRKKLALVSKTSGLILPWNPVFSEPAWSSGGSNVAVKSLDIYNNTLYIGGTFDVIQGITRHNLAAFDLKAGTLTNWNPYASAGVYTIKSSPEGVYAGGVLTSVNGVTRNNLAAFDLSNNTVLPFNPVLSGNWPNCIVGKDSILYLGGYFNSVNGNQVVNLASINKYTGAFIPGMPAVTYGIEDMKIYGNQLFIGGTLATVGDSVRNGLASIDLLSGKVTSWNPNTNSQFDYNTVYSIAISDSTLYAGGTFGNLGVTDRKCIGAFNINTSSILPWNPTQGGTIDGKVRKVLVSGYSVFAGGGFTNIGGTTDQYIAGIDKQSGNVSQWNPGLVSNASGRDGIPGLNDLDIVDSIVYICGPITDVGPEKRSFAASINMATSLPGVWQPDPNDEVYKLLVDTLTKTVYMAGAFTNVKDESQSYFAGYTDPSMGITGINDKEIIPAGLELKQNYPNPFNPSTKINYSISNSGLVSLKVYNLLGQEVGVLVNSMQPAGHYQVTFDGGKLSSGVYCYQLISGSNIITKKMILIK